MDPALTPSDSEGVRVTGFSEPQHFTCRADLLHLQSGFDHNRPSPRVAVEKR